MEVARIWRQQKLRYSLQGAVCTRCGAAQFPARPVCRHCGSPLSSEPQEEAQPGIPVSIPESVPVVIPRGRG
jgi:uncharacterized OB-fold protein